MIAYYWIYLIDIYKTTFGETVEWHTGAFPAEEVLEPSNCRLAHLETYHHGA